MRFTVQLQDRWQGRWLNLFHPAVIEATSALDAMNRIDRDRIGLRAGVTYRFRIEGPTGAWHSDAARRPAWPTTVEEDTDGQA